MLDDDIMSNEQEFPAPNPEDNADQASNTANQASTPPPPPAPPVMQPVPRRSNGWAIFGGTVLATMAAFFVLAFGLFAIGVATFVGVAAGEIEVETKTVKVDIAPTSLDALPARISEESGKIEVDLTEIDIAEFEAADGPIELDVRTDFGAIVVIVPEDLDVAVDAAVDLGEIQVFNNTNDGFDNEIIELDEDADLSLELDVNVGKIEVRRG